MPGIADLFAAQAPAAQPVQNALTQGNEQQAQNVMNMARTAQAGSAVQDMQMKQRSMQLSMLAGLDNIQDPDKREAAKPTVIAMANRLNPSYQIDPKIDEPTRRALIMSGVPVEQQPAYGLAQSNTAINQALLGALGGAPAAAAGAGGGAAPGGMPAPAANTPVAGNAPAAPASPQDGMSSQAQELLAIARPEASKALQGTPFYKRQEEQAVTQGKNTAEAQKNAIESNESYKTVEKNLDSLNDLITTTPLPESKYFVGAKGQAGLSQNIPDYDNQASANAYSTFSTLNESQTIGAIRQLADTGQIKMTRTLENIINRGYLIDPDVSKQAKLQQLNVIKTELKNSAATAQNVATEMAGGGQKAAYEAPYKPQGAAGQAQDALGKNAAAAPKIGTISKGYVYIGGPPHDPNSWKAAQ